jgi:hypothetical protein
MAQIIAWLNQTETVGPNWSDTEWELLKKVARIHGVAAMLHKKIGAERLPEPIQVWLAQQYDFNQQRITRLQSELQTILARFNSAGIPLIPLKGAVLTAVYYQDPGQRPTADLDLLIRPEDLTHSLNLLTQLGYEIEKRNWKHAILSNPANRAVISFEVEHPDNPRRIDLHLACREMFSGPVIDLTAEMWATATERRLLGERTYLISPEMLWRHLLLHTSSNIWNGVLRLINLIDIITLEKTLPSETTLIRWDNEAEVRFNYPARSFCQRYFQRQGRQRLLKHSETAVPPSFQRWLAGQDLVSRSRLHPETKGDYLARLAILYWGRPQNMLAASRFLFSQLKKP